MIKAGVQTAGLVFRVLLEGSWVVISGIISPLIWVIIMVTLLITPPTTTHEPPSKPFVRKGLLS